MVTSGYADHPIDKVKDDSLDMSQYVYGLSDFIMNCETPMTIAIKGEWGSGKTSLMRMIQNILSEQTANSNSQNPVIIPVWFDTWKFSAMELGNQLAISMLGEILNSLDCDSVTIRTMLGGIAKITQATLPLATEVLTGFNSLGDMVKNFIRTNEGEHYGTEIRELQKRFHEIVDRKIKREKAQRVKDEKFLEITQRPDFVKTRHFYFSRAKEKITSQKEYRCLPEDRVVIFIDDLDRIQPDKAVDLLEILKAFLDCPNCVFVLAIDFELVSLGVNIKYKNNLSAEKNKDFFDKMVQLPFTMPITNYDLDSYIKGLSVSDGDINTGEIKHFIEHSVGANPRKIKRIFNTYNLNRKNAQNKFPEMNKEFVNKCVFALACMQEQYPDFLAFLANNNFDRFVFEPFLQPDSTAVYQYHDIFENRDEAYIKQQLDGLRKFILVFEKSFFQQNEKFAKELKELEKLIYKRRQLSLERHRNEERDSGDVSVKQSRIEYFEITQNIKNSIKNLEFLNLNENFNNFKKIIRFISVSNLGKIINPKIQDIADSEEWFKREINIEYVKEIIDGLRDKRIKSDKPKWSVLTPVKMENGIKLSDITGYQKFTTNMYFDYKFEFKVHEESSKYFYVDMILHVYPNNDLQKANIVNLMGKDPLSLMKTPNIKLLGNEYLYYYFNIIKIYNVVVNLKMKESINNYINGKAVKLITSILNNTLSLFQNKFVDGTEIVDKYKSAIINNLVERIHEYDHCFADESFKNHLKRISDRLKDKGNLYYEVAMLHDCLDQHPEQVSVSLLTEVFGNKMVKALQALTIKQGEDLESYSKRVKNNEIALAVKKAELDDILSPERKDKFCKNNLYEERLKKEIERYEELQKMLNRA